MGEFVMNRFSKSAWALLLLTGISTAFHCQPARAQSEQDRTVWMKDAKFGVMTHYLSNWIAQVYDEQMTLDRWNELVDHFDVEGLADQIKSVGAGYHILTIGQGTPYFITPSARFDELFPASGGKAAHRDLVADMSAALHKRELKLIVYATSMGPAGRRPDGSQPLEAPLQGAGRDRRNKERMRNWEAVLRDWSLRWGDKIDGWWIDGIYIPNGTFRFPDPPNFESYAAAMRAGNPNSVVAFNPGVVDRVISFTPFEDYTAGEINDLERSQIRRLVDGRYDGERAHKLSYLGQTWGKGQPRYSDLNTVVIPWTIKLVQAGGAMTWDVPVQRNGIISDPFMEQLRAIGKAIAEAPPASPATSAKK
jgi:alpha-L-fucosidase